MEICVYCASSDAVDAAFVAAAETLGQVLAGRGHGLVYGGGRVGLMGVLARSVHAHGGSVYGVIPEALKQREGLAYGVADELVVTETMQQRKALMFTRAEAFVVLPGGFGTLEEFMEVLTLKQLGYHGKAIVLVNTQGFFDPLLALFEHFFAHRVAHPRYRSLFHLAGTPEAAVAYAESYPRSGPMDVRAVGG